MTMQEQIIRDREVHSCYTFDFVRLQYHNFFSSDLDGMVLYAIQ